MRQIVLDTETTGLEPELNHRIIEIGCVELVNRRSTGRTFHRYLNPERDIDDGALAVHGISRTELDGQPRFAEIADELLAFLGGAELVIHNAAFDVAFLDAELGAPAGRAAPADLAVPDSRHAGAGARAASGSAQQPGRAVQALRRRQLRARAARRTAGCAHSGGRLPGDDRRPGGARAHGGGRDGARPRRGAGRARAVAHRGAAAGAASPAPRSSPRTRRCSPSSPRPAAGAACGA